MTVTVSPVTGKKELAEFIRFPNVLYRDSRWYVPPLEYERKLFFDPGKNPFFHHAEVQLFLARDGAGRPVGRVSAQMDRNYVRFHGEQTGFFGFFDAIDDPEVASALLRSAEGFLAAQGAERALGPLNFTTNDELGVLVEGFEGLPFLMMNYNDPYYDRLLRAAGYDKAKDLFAYYLTNDGVIPPFLERACRKAKASERITLRRLQPDRFPSELGLVKEVYNSAWERNWGFVPMTSEEIDYLASNLKPLVDPSLAYFAFVDGLPAGFFLALPDYNQVLKKMGGKLLPFGIIRYLLGKRRIDRIRVLALGVKREYRGLGIEALFLEEIHRTGHEKGLKAAELSWILEDNEAMNRILRRLTPAPYRKYRVYERAL